MQRQGGILSLLLVVAVSAFGQVSSSIFSTGPDGTRGSATFHVPEYLPRAVVGAPYYGEEVTERVQTLPNGVHITHTDIRQKTWRDSQGRTRTERPMMMGPHLPDAPTVVQITDPVAGYIYTLDTEKKVAHRVAVQQRPERSPSNSPAVTGRAGVRTMLRGAPASGAEQKSDTQRPEVTNEARTKTIDGVASKEPGSRTYPTGSQTTDPSARRTWRSKEP
jgi:hypothetical protein